MIHMALDRDPSLPSQHTLPSESPFTATKGRIVHLKPQGWQRPAMLWEGAHQSWQAQGTPIPGSSLAARGPPKSPQCPVTPLSATPARVTQAHEFTDTSTQLSGVPDLRSQQEHDDCFPGKPHAMVAGSSCWHTGVPLEYPRGAALQTQDTLVTSGLWQEGGCRARAGGCAKAQCATHTASRSPRCCHLFTQQPDLVGFKNVN